VEGVQCSTNLLIILLRIATVNPSVSNMPCLEGDRESEKKSPVFQQRNSGNCTVLYRDLCAGFDERSESSA